MDTLVITTTVSVRSYSKKYQLLGMIGIMSSPAGKSGVPFSGTYTGEYTLQDGNIFFFLYKYCLIFSTIAPQIFLQKCKI